MDQSPFVRANEIMMTQFYDAIRRRQDTVSFCIHEVSLNILYTKSQTLFHTLIRIRLSPLITNNMTKDDAMT